MLYTLFGDVWGWLPSKLINIDSLDHVLIFTSPVKICMSFGAQTCPEQQLGNWAHISMNSGEHKNKHYHVHLYQFVVRTSTRPFGSCDQTLKFTSNICKLAVFLFVAMNSNTTNKYCKTMQSNSLLHPHGFGFSWLFSLRVWQVGLSYGFYFVKARFLTCLIYLQPEVM